MSTRKLLCSATIVILLLISSAVVSALEIGKSEENAFGIQGFTLKRIEVPSYGWWPRQLEYHEFTYKNGTVDMRGTLIKPAGEGPYPAVIVNHGSGGNSREFGLTYGWQFGAKNYVAIACDYTHSDVEQAAAKAKAAPVAGEPPVEGKAKQPAAGGKAKQPGGASPAAPRGNPWKTQTNFDRATALIDILGKLPYVDDARLYMYGHSMGAFLTTVMITKTDKLKAAAITAGGLGHSLSPDPSVAAEAKCPILVMHGTKDTTVDVKCGIQYYEALRDNNKPVEIYLFEGEPHQVIHYRTSEIFKLIFDFFENPPQPPSERAAGRFKKG